MNITKQIVAFFKDAADFCKRGWEGFSGPDYARSPLHQEIERLKSEITLGLEAGERVNYTSLNAISQFAADLPKDGYTVKLAAWAASRSSSYRDLETRFADLWFDCLSVLPARARQAAMIDAQRENTVDPPQSKPLVYSLALKEKVDLAIARKMNFGRVARPGPREQAVL